MKRILNIKICLLAILYSLNFTAQEVFFKDNTTKLKTIVPSHYYPMNFNHPGQEFIRKNDNEKLLGNFYDTEKDRFNNQDRGLNGKVHLPPIVFEEMIKNKVINFSFWAKYDQDVYDGKKSAVLFETSLNGTDLEGDVSCYILDKKIIVEVIKKGRSSAVIKLDFPIDWENEKPGEDTNGYIFFSFNSENTTNGKRTKIYVSRPGGRLYCRSYYVYPFENVQVEKASLRIASTLNNFAGSLAINDLMLFQKAEYVTRTLAPEEVLNNFYLQSPLYEGVSYEINHQHGVMGLEKMANRGVELKDEEYLTFEKQNFSHAPFGYNRFNISKVFSGDDQKLFQIESVKLGARLSGIASNEYAYMEQTGGGEDFEYTRDVSDPESMYTVGKDNFKLVHHNPIEGDFLIDSYEKSGRQWVTVEDRIGVNSNLNISAAVKVFRPLKSYANQKIQLNNYSYNAFIGDNVYTDATIDRHILIKPLQLYHYITFKLFSTGYVGNYTNYQLQSDDPKYILQSKGTTTCSNTTDGVKFVVSNASGVCPFNFIYVKDDSNGSPLYMINYNVHSIRMGVGGTSIENDDRYFGQYYKTKLHTDGTVPDAFLWRVRSND